jgi:signal transduction histidine kinase
MPRRRLSIRWWLGALVAGAALPLLLLLVWIYGTQVRREELEARQTALQIARTTAARMRSLHTDSVALMKEMAARTSIRNLDRAPCDSLFAIVDFFPQYADLLLFDRAGTLVCAAQPAPEDRAVSELARQWIAAALRSGGLRGSAPVIRPLANRWVSVLSAPVRGIDGSVNGTLVLVQLPEAFAASLPPDAVMTILDRDGTIVARSADPRHWTGRNARGVSLAELALHREDGAAEAIGVDGVSRQYGFSSVPELGWHIYVGIPTATVMQPVRQMFVRGAAGGVIIIILIIGVAVLLARAVERPVAALSRAAERAAAGAFGKVSVGGPREIAQLAETFNTMLTRRLEAEHRLLEGERDLKALSDRLLLVQEEERTRIARELHDDLGQSLTALKMDVGGLLAMTPSSAASEPLRNRITRTLDETVTSVQRISSELRPSVLDDLGLLAAIEAEASRFEQRTGIECELSLPEETDLRIEGPAVTAIYRIVQEALTNVSRHANATRVELRLRQRREELLLEIRDDGRGITGEEVRDPFSLGLIGIRERADLAGGTVHIEGVSGRGTIVSVRIPSAASPS